MHELKTYPPRVKMSIHDKSSTSDSFILPVKINGCTEDGQLDVDLLITRESRGISYFAMQLLNFITLFSVGLLPLVASSASSLDSASPQAIYNSAPPWTTQSHLVRCKCTYIQ